MVKLKFSKGKASRIVGLNPKLVRAIGYGSGTVPNPISMDNFKKKKHHGFNGVGGY